MNHGKICIFSKEDFVCDRHNISGNTDGGGGRDLFQYPMDVRYMEQSDDG